MLRSVLHDRNILVCRSQHVIDPVATSNSVGVRLESTALDCSKLERQQRACALQHGVDASVVIHRAG
jgi:hypothetical protein